MVRALLRILLFAVILGFAFYLNRTGLLEKTLLWIDSFGHAGPVAFVFVYAVTCVFFVPSIVFTFSGGVLFGFWKGAMLSLAGQGLGSLGAFLIGRTLARDFVARKFEKNPAFTKLARAAEKQGWKIIALARLSPIFPFLAGNYAFGTTSIRATHYLGGSLLGTIPSTSLYTYLGTVFGSIAAVSMPGRARTWQEWLFLIAGLAATVFFCFYLRRFAQKALAN